MNKTMKKIIAPQFKKFLFVIVGILLVSLLFRFIENQTIKTVLGIAGFLLMLISLRKLKSQKNENI